ncbi:MAG: hypothetical protein WDN31_14555 [Hyphomicrobium sp.]
MSRYDVLYCDVWGVLHDGHHAFPAACDALMRFRARGGTVILVSNAPVPGEQVGVMLDARAVPREAYDDIVASGAIALRHLAEKGYRRIACIGPRDRDAATFSKVTAECVDLEDAKPSCAPASTTTRTRRPRTIARCWCAPGN